MRTRWDTAKSVFYLVALILALAVLMPALVVGVQAIVGRW
jgi:hypothetical protein